ncbi:hypothetical protein KIN20_026064 [Parelaphostrongylus tenuis]|uniref:Uncharacterized protein n=1 Tax=Parelaphostrongylus tenuis TaxID=148309 RepID=A0AAD5QX99_PARTN|nr:hypothetical protein KIN20_026064 [Parelaphostrongylus tenuis]
MEKNVDQAEISASEMLIYKGISFRAASIYEQRMGVFPTGTQYLTMYNSLNDNNAKDINLLAFLYNASSQGLWAQYSFEDWLRSNFSMPSGESLSALSAKIISKMDNINGLMDSVSWGTASQLDIYEGIVILTSSTISEKPMKSLNSTTSISTNNTVELPSARYTFVSRGVDRSSEVVKVPQLFTWSSLPVRRLIGHLTPAKLSWDWSDLAE